MSTIKSIFYRRPSNGDIIQYTAGAAFTADGTSNGTTFLPCKENSPNTNGAFILKFGVGTIPANQTSVTIAYSGLGDFPNFSINFQVTPYISTANLFVTNSPPPDLTGFTVSRQSSTPSVQIFFWQAIGI